MTYMNKVASVAYASLLFASACLPARLTPADIRANYQECVGVAEIPTPVNGKNDPALARTAGMNRARNDYLVQCVKDASREEVIPVLGGEVRLRYVAASVEDLETGLDRNYAVARPGSQGVTLTWTLADGQEEALGKVEEARKAEEAKKAEEARKAEKDKKAAEAGKSEKGKSEKGFIDKAKDLVDRLNPF